MGQASLATLIRTELTRVLWRKFLRAIALAENLCKSDLQLTQFVAVSGDDALQREQDCTVCLLKLIFLIVHCEVYPEKVFSKELQNNMIIL